MSYVVDASLQVASLSAAETFGDRDQIIFPPKNLFDA